MRYTSADEARWFPLLAARVPDAAATVREGARFGVVTVYGWPATGPATGVLVVRLTNGHAAILLGAGDLGPEPLAALLAAIKAEALAVTVAADVAAGWGAGLAALGFAPLAHVERVNDLATTAARIPTHFTDPALVPWEPGLTEPAAELIARVHAHTGAGLLLTLPDAPTIEALMALTRDVLRPDGALMPEVSFAYRRHHAVVGVVVVLREGPDPVVWDLAVLPAVRGEGVGRLLLQAAQRALFERGETCIRYWTTADNDRIHRLCSDAESTLIDCNQAMAWLRAAV